MLISRIIDNIQISINNVYFRFEDTGKDKRTGLDQVFSIGLMLKEFSVFTADKEYKRVKDSKKVEKKDGLTFKVVHLQGLSIFCDWKNVISVKVTKSDKPE
jgi:hypothetical protein